MGNLTARWWYQVMRHTDDSGQHYLAIHEAYTLHDGKDGWTAKPVPIEADSVNEMYQALHRILTDFDKHGVRDAATGEKIHD